MELLWDFSSLSNKRVEVRTRTTEEIIAITPVLFAGSETAPDSIRRGIPMPESLSNALSLIRESEDIFHHLPKTIRSLVEIRKQSDDRSANKIDAPSLNSAEWEWGCGMACGGVIGSGILTVVSGGALTPGLIMGAAGCGSCMGFIWGAPPTAHGPITLGPGTEGHAGSPMLVLWNSGFS